MRTFVVIVCVAFAAWTAAAPVPAPSTREAASLVEKLGAADFTEREAAGKRLEELGVLALDDLRAACKSDNPEIADRAKDLVRKIERRVTSDRLLAPTLVELSAKDTPLDDVLATLSKQAGCEVVVGGFKADEVAAKKITVATAGKVPFWAAVLKICEAADLQVAGAGGFVAQGAIPYRGRTNEIRGAIEGAKTRVAADINNAVILEVRDGRNHRPASVHGAVLVEAFEPRGAGGRNPAAMLHFWPEPKIPWQMVANLKIVKATDTDGRKLTPDLTPPPRVPERLGRPLPADNSGNLRQAVAKFKPSDGPLNRARELTGSAFALVRVSAEPLATVTLDPEKMVSVTGQSGVELSAADRTEKDKRFVVIKLAYNTLEVVPARNGDMGTVRTGDEAPNVKLTVDGDKLTHGLRVLDATGKPFETTLSSSFGDFDRTNPRRLVMSFKLELVIAKDGPTVPAKVVFWGATTKPVEVPFALKDVPLR